MLNPPDRIEPKRSVRRSRTAKDAKSDSSLIEELISAIGGTELDISKFCAQVVIFVPVYIVVTWNELSFKERVTGGTLALMSCLVLSSIFSLTCCGRIAKWSISPAPVAIASRVRHATRALSRIQMAPQRPLSLARNSECSRDGTARLDDHLCMRFVQR
jgi:hypothetical protein